MRLSNLISQTADAVEADNVNGIDPDELRVAARALDAATILLRDYARLLRERGELHRMHPLLAYFALVKESDRL